MPNPGRPLPNEHAPYYSRYIDRVTEEDIVAALEAQARETSVLLSRVGEEKGRFRYAPDKWSVKQVVGHMTDSERIFAYRALSIARGETKSLPGFEENDYVANGGFDERSFSEVVNDLAVTRQATLSLLRGLSDQAWRRVGTANDMPVSVRALAYIMLGHERHHLAVLRERYGVTS